MFGGFLITAFHVEQREVGMDELFVGIEFLSLVAFLDGGRIIAFAIIRHPQ